MRPMVIALLIAAGMALAASTSQPASTQPVPGVDEPWGPVPQGLLGYPLGTYLTIEGVRVDNTAKEAMGPVLKVDTVNGKKLQTPVLIHGDLYQWKLTEGPFKRPMEAFGNVPTGQRCVVSGYETGKLNAPSPKVYRAEGLVVEPADSRVAVSQPVPWTFGWAFVVTSMAKPEVVKPK